MDVWSLPAWASAAYSLSVIFHRKIATRKHVYDSGREDHASNAIPCELPLLVGTGFGPDSRAPIQVSGVWARPTRRVDTRADPKLLQNTPVAQKTPNILRKGNRILLEDVRHHPPHGAKINLHEIQCDQASLGNRGLPKLKSLSLPALLGKTSQ